MCFRSFFLVLTWCQSVKGRGVLNYPKEINSFKWTYQRHTILKKITLEPRITSHLSNAESNKLTRSTNFVTIVRDYYDDLQQCLL